MYRRFSLTDPSRRKKETRNPRLAMEPRGYFFRIRFWPIPFIFSFLAFSGRSRGGQGEGKKRLRYLRPRVPHGKLRATFFAAFPAELEKKLERDADVGLLYRAAG